MGRADKRLDGMRQNPQGWAIADVQAVCAALGLTCSPPKRGSHWKVSHPHRDTILTIPARRPIKPVYIEALVKLIDGTESEK